MVAAFLIMIGSGIMGGTAALTTAQGGYYLFAACPIAFGGWFSALKQAEVATAGISVLAKKPEAVGKAVISASFVELYAILALLISLLLILTLLTRVCPKARLHLRRFAAFVLSMVNCTL
jgi:V/A-type H+-transporting ATPase subunit K